ncbi:amidohydrolase family protein [Georgenia alba]|uniref:Amidohydrolase family protein n=1 Tax=Georgenia alba TaxID=2233858 RepID=A0ABW2Q4H6_9MICO
MSVPGAGVIVAGLLLDGTGGPGVEDAAILFDDGRIVAAGPATAVLAHPAAADARRRDLDTSTLTPGLVDAHVHLAYGRPTDPGWPDMAPRPQGYSAWALAGAQSALSRGVTTVRDCGSPEGIALDVRRLLRTGLVRGARVLACGPCLTTSGGHGEFLGVTADGTEELRARLRDLAPQRPDAVKVMATGGSMDPHTDRRSAQYSTDELAAVVAEADRLGVQVVAHANATEGIRRAVLAGVQVIAHCNFLAAQDGRLDVDHEVIAEMAARKVYVDLNLGAAMVPLREVDARQEPPEADVPEDRWRLLRSLPELAPRTFFTSDAFGPAVGDFPDLLAQAARRWQLSLAEVLWRATGLPAEAMGKGATFGSLLPGRVADICVYDGDLRTDPDLLGSPQMVLQAGIPVAGPGRLATR